jgi:hypothetical protein
VETFGAMAKTEKIAFILEQVKYMLCLFSEILGYDPVIMLTRFLKSCQEVSKQKIRLCGRSWV